MNSLVRRTVLASILLTPLAGALSAQSRDQPSLAFTISGGLNAGGDLWQVDKQVLRSTTGGQDTATVNRRLRPGLTATLGMSYFQSPHFGWNAEIAFYGLGTEQDCRGPAVYSDAFNQKVCTSASGGHIGSNLISFQGGGTWRLGDPDKVTPYVRANLGVAFIGNSFVETSTFIQDPACTTADNVCEVKIITERNPRTFTWTTSLAIGVSMPIGSGYRFRMEGRDLITALPVIDSPALIGVNSQPVSDSHMKLKNIPIFTFGFDVLLERSHARRY
ncbi:MAG TPA: hypothetical protein VGI92_00340 [Gemmatimonadales bacterium]|jgi:hypothetical protein